MTTSTFKRLAIPAALVVGGVTAGSLLSPIGLASAQDDDADTDTTGSDSDGGSVATDDGGPDHDHDHRHGRRGPHFGARGEVLEEALGLSAEEIRDGLAEGKTLAELAEEQGVSTEDLTAALVAAATEHIDQAVADGKLDADEAEERKAGLEERITDLVNRTPPEGLGDGPGLRGRFGPPPGLEVAEEVLGLSREEIRDGLAEGKTLADLAEEQRVPVDELADALAADAIERLDQAVEDGKLDADRAAEAKEHLEEMIDRAINAEPFALGRMEGRREGRLANRALRRHHRMDHHGAGHAPDDGSTAESSTTAGGDGSVEDVGF
jgi:hypothetical protein